LWTPAIAIFQKSEVLLVTNATFSALAEPVPPRSQAMMAIDAKSPKTNHLRPACNGFSMFTAFLLGSRRQMKVDDLAGRSLLRNADL
jgi:hypothetical protein